MVFEISRETDKKKEKKIGRLCFEPVSRQKNLSSGPFNPTIACANKAAVTDYRNYMADKTYRNKRFLLFFVEQKISRGKLSFFLHTLFVENEAQINRNNYGTMLSMSKQVSLPKISSIPQKMKIGQNSIYALFARSPSITIIIIKF